MKHFTKAIELKEYLNSIRLSGKKIGFVPTMGALHHGHLSLIHQSQKQSGHTIVSIFVNPTQFNNPEDFRLYPTQTEKDTALLHEVGCDTVFMPDFNEIYPNGTSALPAYNRGYLESIMEGKYRPGHFQGVCQVVDILLEMVQPDLLFLGQKDLQQCKVIEQLLKIKGQSGTIQLVICPTLREADGLAMSSRNQRLSEEQRIKAAVIYQSLNKIRESVSVHSFIQIRDVAIKMMEAAGMDVEYLELVDLSNLEILDKWDKNRSMAVCVAANIGSVRLIDNMIL